MWKAAAITHHCVSSRSVEWRIKLALPDQRGTDCLQKICRNFYTYYLLTTSNCDCGVDAESDRSAHAVLSSIERSVVPSSAAKYAFKDSVMRCHLVWLCKSRDLISNLYSGEWTRVLRQGRFWWIQLLRPHTHSSEETVRMSVRDDARKVCFQRLPFGLWEHADRYWVVRLAPQYVR